MTNYIRVSTPSKPKNISTSKQLSISPEIMHLHTPRHLSIKPLSCHEFTSSKGRLWTNGQQSVAIRMDSTEPALLAFTAVGCLEEIDSGYVVDVGVYISSVGFIFMTADFSEYGSVSFHAHQLIPWSAFSV